MRVRELVLVVAGAAAFVAEGPRSPPRVAWTPLRAGFGAPPKNKPPAVEKRYTKAALEKSYEAFDAIQERGGFTVDCYCGAPQGSKLFFVGKIAHDMKTPPECALAALRHLLVPHACFLQPLLAASKDKLVWGVAKGGTEVAVAKGEEPITMIDFGKAKASHNPGFSPEWYEAGEDGFYVRREEA